MNAVFSFELWNNTRRYEILHILNIGCSFLPPESRAIINDLDVILHGFMLQITYTTLFQVKRLNNLTLRVRLFNRLTPKTVVKYIGTIEKQYK
jgi:hypothetical protein